MEERCLTGRNKPRRRFRGSFSVFDFLPFPPVFFDPPPTQFFPFRGEADDSGAESESEGDNSGPDVATDASGNSRVFVLADDSGAEGETDGCVSVLGDDSGGDGEIDSFNNTFFLLFDNDSDAMGDG